MHQLYPLKFKTILKERIWGGEKLKTVLSKQGKNNAYGESWELSAVEGDISVVSNGFLKGNNLQEIVEIYMGDIVGDKVFEKFGDEFPLLIKFIDANDDLSIQVHPDDKLARERHNSYGKTEMWYVMDANPGASLISGFSKPVTKEEYLNSVTNKTLKDILYRQPVVAGDTFFIPAGRVHAIGSGILLAEIQQTSDITYRIYDWDRVDDKGNPRELHTELAVDAIDYTFHADVKTAYTSKENAAVNLAKCDYFTTNKIQINKPLDRDYIELDSFVIYICCNGKFDLIYNETEKIEVTKGETVLLPNVLKNIRLVPSVEAEILEVYI
ncbi:MAG: mannose-6-phosphate isomerase [Bacteroidota bacterium]|nr:mannose-6-phosphate isomerase [Bacteroidota bacterium]